MLLGLANVRKNTEFIICTTPVSRPESTSMAALFVKIIKRDHGYLNDLPNTTTVMEKLADYNNWHPHKRLSSPEISAGDVSN